MELPGGAGEDFCWAWWFWDGFLNVLVFLGGFFVDFVWFCCGFLWSKAVCPFSSVFGF